MCSPEDKAIPFRVLTIDGGGIRGLYTAALLKDIMDHYAQLRGVKSGLDIGTGFDLIAGTSTGGILACALAKGLHPDKVVSLYSEHGPSIFPSPQPSGKGSALIRWAWKHRRSSSANGLALKKRLEDVFGTTTLADLYRERRIALCVPAVHAETSCSKVFKTPHDPDFTIDSCFKLSDVCLATSAAPIVFPVAKIQDHRNAYRQCCFLDGGLWANNPVLVGLIEALHINKLNGEEDRPIDIFSVGTCSPATGHAITNPDRGVFDWNFGVGPLGLSIDAQATGHGYMAVHIARYLKCEANIVRLPCSSPSSGEAQHLALDNPSQEAVQVLLDRARHDSQTVLSKIKNGDADLCRLALVFEMMKPYEEVYQ
ncbi:Patatin-like phospholipase [Desulfomicrobium norvegicum]|uniref:Patatin-like phospholipase n=1 Tax=Desulfomicrobium norvegicum (strain DSM 1741 / NCIMB 8310) TaxID=52561 RepID=A0A8G2FEZ8_DESNO|nr:CBASS cGAMP-activated phospholipase [Desulfomicrobium norvegicum]SFL89316.1 Patatin-like phospholipase [Desulfomicrobium norvegicum]